MAGSGAGSRLPTPVLLLAGVSAFVAVVVSFWSILLQLRSYRKPALQRMVIRIMVMVPIYAIASLISLFSVEAAFVIDAIRDIYEAFVIYCFFVLLLTYLGGERSLLILLHGRAPKDPIFPINLFSREIDISDPYTFLFLKRGILQYVQIKPLLAAATLILKAVGKYNEGDFRANSGYLYISIVYNVSICVALYCLAMFWMCVNEDLKPFRPVPKFLCVKGILFFSFWQSVGISILVAAAIITKLGPYTDAEHVSVGLNDLLICVEMPFFAFAHMYAFSYKDYIDTKHSFAARMPMYYAFRDAFGLKDVVEDTKATLRGEGMDYREFEPAEGFMHQGLGRERRIRAGLRYSKGGQRKYWLPKADDDTRPPGRAGRIINNVIKRVAGDDEAESVHAPLLAQEADNVYHNAPDLQGPEDELTIWGDSEVDDGFDLPFGDIDEGDEELFEGSRRYLFGDYNYPTIDVSSESARVTIWDEEERVLRDERGAWFSPIRGAKGQAAIRERVRPAWSGYGAVSDAPNPNQSTKSKTRQFYDDRTGETSTNAKTKVIDHESNRSAIPAKPQDVIMTWTKTKDSHSRSPHIRNSHQTPSASAASSGPSSSSGNGNSPRNRFRSPPSLSRTNSQLPPDAVDLVVEDPRAAEGEQTHERKKGEPATRTPAASGLKKVYRRGFVVGDEDPDKHLEGEVQIEETGNSDSRRVEAGGRIFDAIESDSDGESPSAGERQHPKETMHNAVEGVIARSGTPPLHAQVHTYNFAEIPDDNPWA